MHITAIFGAFRSGPSSPSKAPAVATAVGTPVKSAKLKAAAGRRNPRSAKISNSVLVQPTAAERAVVREIHRQYIVPATDRYSRGGHGGLQRRPRVVKPKKNKKTEGDRVQHSVLQNEQEQDQNEIEYAAAANPVRVEVAQLGLSPLEELELQLLGVLAATGEMMIDSSF